MGKIDSSSQNKRKKNKSTKTKGFRVIFERNSETFDQSICDSVITQFMTLICRVGLSVDEPQNDDKINKEREQDD